MQYKVKYGWCYTDHKDGRDLHYRDDYVLDDKYRETVFNALEEHDLPIPKKDQIFRGTEHDMLFIDSHALVVRIGHIDIDKMINPCILQPIEWKSYDIAGDDEPLTMAIYPGIDLIYSVADKIDVDDAIDMISSDIYNAGHVFEDTIYDNYGSVTLQREEGVDYIPLVLDTENSSNRPLEDTLPKINSVKLQAKELTSNKAEQMQIVMDDLYAGNPRLSGYMEAFYKHQPLRLEFANAAQSDDKSLFGKALDKCAAVAINPQEISFPIWKQENGVFKQAKLKKAKVSLYSPWQRS